MNRAPSVAARVLVACLILTSQTKVGWGQAVLAWVF